MKYRTEKEILQMMLNQAQTSELISVDDQFIQQVLRGEITENQYIIDLSAHAYVLHDFSRQLESVNQSVDVATAVGAQLDKIGNLLNVPRHMGVAAQLEVELNLTLPEDNPIFIPRGTELIIDALQVPDYVTYSTDEDVTIPAGVTTATVLCSSNLMARQRSVAIDSVYGLNGFPQISTFNRDAGTSGRDIENDGEYRQRILLWNVANQRGTRQCFDAYLGDLEGLDDYLLVPRPEGEIGTLTIVCDCIESQLSRIEEGVQEHCMIFTDQPAECVGVSRTPLNVSVSCSVVDNPISYTVAELQQLIESEVKVFIDGGYNRDGSSNRGLRIGESFTQSRLLSHLHNMFPELLSISSSTEDTTVDEYHKFRCGTVTVVI